MLGGFFVLIFLTFNKLEFFLHSSIKYSDFIPRFCNNIAALDCFKIALTINFHFHNTVHQAKRTAQVSRQNDALVKLKRYIKKALGFRFRTRRATPAHTPKCLLGTPDI